MARLKVTLRKAGLVALAAGVMALVVLVILARLPPENERPSETAGVVEDSAPETRAPVLPAALLGGKHIAELPSATLPLKESLPQLEALAAQGNPVAACRIAAGLEFCNQMPAWREDHARWLAERELALKLGTSNNSAGVETFGEVFEIELSSREGRLRNAQERCEGIEPIRPGALVARWRRAAIAGSPSAIRHYASGGVFHWDNIVELTPELQQWRTEAYALALDLARQGDLEMSLLLAASYSPLSGQGRPLLSQALSPDGAFALELYRRASDALRSADTRQTRSLLRRVQGEIEQLEPMVDGQAQPDASNGATDALSQWEPIDLGGDLSEVELSGGVPESPVDPCDVDSREARIE